ncbi:MAG: NfeD family protein, partial [Parachlamydiaceae bacterium]
MNPYLLLILGLLLVFLEFYLPGAILGALGAIFIVSSYVVLIYQGTTPLEFGLFFLGSMLAIYGLIRFALWRIPRAKPGRSIYLKGDQEGYVASHFDKNAIGKEGVVLTDLKPGGYILIDGVQHQAISIEGYVSKGRKITVLS